MASKHQKQYDIVSRSLSSVRIAVISTSAEDEYKNEEDVLLIGRGLLSVLDTITIFMSDQLKQSDKDFDPEEFKRKSRYGETLA